MAWPAAIVALLLLSGVTTFAVLFASRSDGGAQVVENYYRKSVAWDSLSSSRRSSDSLGWHLSLDVRSDALSSEVGLATFMDAEGQAVTGLSGSVTVSRPQSSVVYGTHSLVADDSTAGRYSFSFPYRERGLWDLDVAVSRSGKKFFERIRVEI